VGFFYFAQEGAKVGVAEIERGFDSLPLDEVTGDEGVNVHVSDPHVGGVLGFES
jgi:hypothetical protein